VRSSLALGLTKNYNDDKQKFDTKTTQGDGGKSGSSGPSKKQKVAEERSKPMDKEEGQVSYDKDAEMKDKSNSSGHSLSTGFDTMTQEDNSFETEEKKAEAGNVLGIFMITNKSASAQVLSPRSILGYRIH
jgi:hypothetical protein